MIRLSARLSAICLAAGEGGCVADIGSDHALVPSALLLSGSFQRAIASDLRPGPLEAGRKKAERYGVADRMEFIVSDGFSALAPGSFDKALICGMGGELIARIIAEGGEKAHCPLVLQPMTGFSELREFLWTNGFCIEGEDFAAEGAKPYGIFRAVYTGRNTGFTYPDLFLGQSRPDTPEFSLFCKKTLTAARKRQTGELLRGSESAEIKALIGECERILG